MTPEQTAHLSEEAINDVLIGLGSSDAEAHLGACPICRSRVETFQSDMHAFNQTSLAWSEARPMPAIESTRIAKVNPWIVSPLLWALAASLFVAVGLPLWNSNHRDASSGSAGNASGSETLSLNSEEQIAQDNELLRSVNVALNEAETSPVAEYHLTEGPQPHKIARTELRNQ